MRFTFASFAIAAALVAAPAAAQTKPSATQGWQIPARTLPPPVHASEELRKKLAETPSPDPVAAKAATPRTLEEWRAELAKAAVPDAVLYGIAKAQGVTVTPERIAGVQVYRVTPAKIAPEFQGKLFVYIHGGAFIKGGGAASSVEAIAIARHLGLEAISIDYRMAPDHPAPAASLDTLAVWRELLKSRDAKTMFMGGTSAGANLTLVTTLRAKAAGLPLPAALMVGTPPADLTKATDTRFLLEGADRYLPSWDAEPAAAMALYAAGADLKDPFLSPIFGDMSNFPPSYLITGTRDLMLSDTALIHRKLRRAGVRADLHVYEGHSHGDYVIMAGTPESEEHYKELAQFLQEVAPAKNGVMAAGLAGTKWQMLAYQSSDDAIGRVLPDNPARYTVEFLPGNRAAIRLDCNRGNGKYAGGVGSSGSLTFGPLATTRAACAPNAINRRFEQSIPSVRSFILKDGRLFLALQADSAVLEFEQIVRQPR
jgi:epsilon-lactone hydrolase